MEWRYRETVLALCTLAFFVTMVGRLAISPVLPDIVSTFSTTNAVVGLSLTGMWLAYGLAQYPSGLLADRYGERLIILIAVGGTAGAALLVALAPALWLFFGATVLLGGVAGLHYSVATAFLARTYESVGTAIGVHNAGGTVAGLVAPIAVAWLAVQFGWRVAVGTVAIVGIPVAVVFALKIRSPEPRYPETPLRKRVDPETASAVLTRPAVAFTLLISIVGEFAWQGTASFLPTFLIEHHNVSTALAGAIFSAYFVVQGVARSASVPSRIGLDETALSPPACSLVPLATVFSSRCLVSDGCSSASHCWVLR